MSKLLSENDVLKQLGISNFRQVTKDKLMEFTSLLNEMNPEVAKKAIELFPQFAKMSLEAMTEYRSLLEKTLDENTESSKQTFNIYDEIIGTLKDSIEKENLTFEEKQFYIEKMIEVAKMAEKKDTENKNFNWKIASAAAVGVATVLGVSVSVLGGKTKKRSNSK
ncbi:hypothetical protein BKP56_12670 [Marinilactibacillus sp. 15R]|uniref:hypothetical protein n=1 Tax=Marinilactibacillus sp. 15R TaxID=1911586 RepID=UPI00090B85A6|nr:hypothetical protein [Marinilactibacillus sp. 15R]API90057.1 hypothetical protein BKP56_12670 [Marinilactibacillus sp. 15R]